MRTRELLRSQCDGDGRGAKDLRPEIRERHQQPGRAKRVDPSALTSVLLLANTGLTANLGHAITHYVEDSGPRLRTRANPM